MSINLFKRNPLVLRLAAVSLFQAVTLALVVTLATPAIAAGERMAKTKVAPGYPELARRMKIEGVVTVEATVDPTGAVTAVKVVSGNLILAPAAEDAVRKWTFEPGPGTSKVNVDVGFNLVR